MLFLWFSHINVVSSYSHTSPVNQLDPHAVELQAEDRCFLRGLGISTCYSIHMTNVNKYQLYTHSCTCIYIYINKSYGIICPLGTNFWKGTFTQELRFCSFFLPKAKWAVFWKWTISWVLLNQFFYRNQCEPLSLETFHGTNFGKFQRGFKHPSNKRLGLSHHHTLVNKTIYAFVYI